MRKSSIAALALVSSQASGAVLNMDFGFVPFTGNIKNPTVQTVPGRASLFVNNVLMTEVPVAKREAPVMFDERQVRGAVYMTTSSLGPVLRKGKNKLRIEFEPAEREAKYSTQLSWSSVTDKTTTSKTASGATQETNLIGAGVEVKPATGKALLEREFVADFATALPWHRYPAVTSISEEDKKRLTALVRERTDLFKPDFAAAYQLLRGSIYVDVAEVQKLKCLDAAYAAGVRVGVAPAAELDFATTGNPEIVVKRRSGDLYTFDMKAFDKMKNHDRQICAGMALSVLYSQRLMAVRTPSGEWQVVY